MKRQNKTEKEKNMKLTIDRETFKHIKQMTRSRPS